MIEGSWTMTMDTPLGEQHTHLMIERQGNELSGQLTDEKSGEVSPIERVNENGSHAEWTQNVTKPMKMTVTFNITVEGDMFSGTAKPRMFPAAKVVGQRVSFDK